MANNFYISGTRIPSLGKAAPKFGFYCRIVGQQNVERAILNKIAKIKGRTREGIYKAIQYLENNMDTIPPVVPEKTGNLKKAFTYYEATTSTPDNPVVLFGYKMEPKPEGAPYAWYVHEMTAPPYGNVNWTRPGSGPKWFEIALKRDRDAMIAIIEANVMREF